MFIIHVYYNKKSKNKHERFSLNLKYNQNRMQENFVFVYLQHYNESGNASHHVRIEHELLNKYEP